MYLYSRKKVYHGSSHRLSPLCPAVIPAREPSLTPAVQELIAPGVLLGGGGFSEPHLRAENFSFDIVCL